MHKQHSFFGEDTAKPLLDWLNDSAVEKEKKEPLTTFLEWNRGLRFLKPTKLTVDHVDFAYRTTSVLNSTTFRPILEPKTEWRSGRKYWSGGWRLAWYRLPGFGQNAANQAFFALTELADLDVLTRIRKCALRGCGQWFFARFNHQLHHQAKCAQAVYRADPAWKTKRAEYMKGLRRKEKKREKR